MAEDFGKNYIADLGRKLSHLQGALGAYLPQRVFDTEVQKEIIDCDKYAFSRLLAGKRMAANWELGRFVDLFELARYGFDYRIFLQPLGDFEAAIADAGVGCYGVTARYRLRERLRSKVAPTVRIKVSRDRHLNVGGIGGVAEDTGIMCLTPRDQVTLTVPLHPVQDQRHFLLLLHDFPGGRATSCLMPSIFAPENGVFSNSVRLPLVSSGYFSFPVNGSPGYRCLYGIESPTDLAAYIGLLEPEAGVPDIHDSQIALLVDYLENSSREEQARTHVTFAEYLLK